MPRRSGISIGSKWALLAWGAKKLLETSMPPARVERPGMMNLGLVMDLLWQVLQEIWRERAGSPKMKGRSKATCPNAGEGGSGFGGAAGGHVQDLAGAGNLFIDIGAGRKAGRDGSGGVERGTAQRK